MALYDLAGQVLQEDVKGAEEFVKGEITRLLSGRCEAWEMVMTGGLWRVTGQQVASAAEGTAPAEGEEVRGPHASLAVRLSVMTLHSCPHPSTYSIAELCKREVLAHPAPPETESASEVNEHS